MHGGEGGFKGGGVDPRGVGVDLRGVGVDPGGRGGSRGCIFWGGGGFQDPQVKPLIFLQQ